MRVEFARLLGFLLAFALSAGSVSLGQGTEQAPPKGAAKGAAKKKATGKAEPKGFYMGRRIAPIMTYEGADWLVRPEREQEEQPEKMLDALKIQPGWTVADVGAGVGYTSVRLASRVGPTGKVLATDLQPQMISMLKANLQDAGIKNVQPILCSASDAKLPEAKIDMIIMVDVYHECPDPVLILSQMKKGLRPGGKLVLIEFKGDDPNVPIKPEHTMTVAQAKKELEANGFKLKESQDFLPWQYILTFESVAAEAEKDQ